MGKLLGPRGNSLKRLQEETLTKMSILGKGSMRDKTKVRLEYFSRECLRYLNFFLKFLERSTSPVTKSQGANKKHQICLY